jgi:hypothetical protein
MDTPLFCYMRSLLLGSDQERIPLTPKNNNMVPVRWVHPSFVICGPLGPDRERSHLTPKNNYMVPVRWVHPSLTIYGLLGPDQERSNLTPKKQLHSPS